MLKYVDFKMLIQLHENKSITTASEQLFITQPALTKWLRRIEEDIGIIIVNRSVRGIVFTPEGEHLVRYAHYALDNYQNLLKELQDIKDDRSITVSIMGAGSLVSHLLPKLLSAYKEFNSNVKYNLQYAGSNKTAKGIYEGLADVGFLRGEPWTNCQKELIRTEYATIVSKNEIDLERLPHLPRIDADFSESAHLFINNWWQNTYDSPPSIAMRVPNIATCIGMVREGLGYSIIISSNVYEDIPNLYIYPLRDKTGNYVTRSDYMVWKKELDHNETTASFIEFSKNYFKALRESNDVLKKLEVVENLTATQRPKEKNP